MSFLVVCEEGAPIMFCWVTITATGCLCAKIHQFYEFPYFAGLMELSFHTMICCHFFLHQCLHFLCRCKLF